MCDQTSQVTECEACGRDPPVLTAEELTFRGLR
jgi:hypothetical protein